MLLKMAVITTEMQSQLSHRDITDIYSAVETLDPFLPEGKRFKALVVQPAKWGRMSIHTMGLNDTCALE